ncbi:PadR family transcriptional regulator [Alkalicoccobacillus murimartini]|uniref:DNA-binding PadR family transcriptional regulator n=1 Tax=Alkalicoccobacillus murimartini TaxID=171685 RepID=A0ABT9YMF1_9BACI|nr:PadR family transcriptional regulator [Alkalicoccobacillus murimartini]MDQ0208665.1 DNA-binding PadR family transcriptional regulator [Alkalicoccobacillus murimartini]
MSLQYALLGIISKKPATGYDVVRIFKEQMVYFWNSTHSQIYTELHKMETKGLIHHELVIQHTSPNKKIYSLTDQGRKDLVQWAIEQPLKPAKIKDEFLIKTAAFNVLTVQDMIKLIDDVIERENKVLEMTNSWREHYINQEENDLGTMLTIEYGIRYSKMYLDWCTWAKDYIENSFLNKGSS